jgi:hypothetical protein
LADHADCKVTQELVRCIRAKPTACIPIAWVVYRSNQHCPLRQNSRDSHLAQREFLRLVRQYVLSIFLFVRFEADEANAVMFTEHCSGFDETVVVTDLRNHGNPKSSTVIGKYNAHDAVSSVRWSPVHSHLSWTTDGGDFQLMDTRVHSPQLHKPLYMVQVRHAKCWLSSTVSHFPVFF